MLDADAFSGFFECLGAPRFAVYRVWLAELVGQLWNFDGFRELEVEEIGLCVSEPVGAHFAAAAQLVTEDDIEESVNGIPYAGEMPHLFGPPPHCNRPRVEFFVGVGVKLHDLFVRNG